MPITLSVNGQTQSVDVPPDMPLLWVLRDVLGLTGTKYGCGIAQCGACTVHLDGRPLRSCVLPVGSVGSRAVTTIEAVGQTSAGAKAQRAWLAVEVVQCGYCQSGQIMSQRIFSRAGQPTDADIDVTALGGNICRCHTYPRIRRAIKLAAKCMSGRQAPDVVRLVTDRRRVVLGGGLLLGFAIVSTKPYARGGQAKPTAPAARQRHGAAPAISARRLVATIPRP